MKQFIITCILFVFLFNPGIVISLETQDSLVMALQSARGPQKYEILLQLVEKVYKKDRAAALSYLKEAINLNKKYDDKRSFSKCYPICRNAFNNNSDNRITKHSNNPKIKIA